MVRHSDIRIFLGKTFPLITVGDNIQFIELVLTAAETITEENESTIFIYNNRSFSLIKAGQGKIIINENGLFQIHDLNKALSEFRCLKDTYGNVPYTDIFFGEGTYPETMAFTNSSKALLNAKIYASVMKRVYNWFRFGSDNPIYINHHVGSQLAACIMIDAITYQEGKPVIGLNIIQNDVVIQSVKVNLPFLIKTDELINKYTPKVICLTEVKTLMNQININSHSLVTLSMIEKMANALASRQYTKGEIRVTLQTKNRAIRLIGTNNPDLGGVSFIESNSELSTANVLNEDRILIGTLINGLALLRREYGDDYLAISGEHISPIDITPDIFSSMFFVGTSCYQDIVDNITARVARGQKTFSSFDEKGVRVRCASWTGNKPYYSIECVSGDKMFIFDDYFSLTSLIEAAGEKTRVFEEATPAGFIQRLKQSWFGMFA